MNELDMRANVILFGLSEGLSNDLQQVLARLGGGLDAVPLESAEACLDIARQRGADVLFCAPDTTLVRELRARCPHAVIIAASRFPNTDDWLDTIEAGANDYCAAPFETAQLRWILQSNLLHSRLAA